MTERQLSLPVSSVGPSSDVNEQGMRCLAAWYHFESQVGAAVRIAGRQRLASGPPATAASIHSDRVAHSPTARWPTEICIDSKICGSSQLCV